MIPANWPSPLSPSHQRALQRAFVRLERQNFAARLADYAGQPVDRVLRAMPTLASQGLNGIIEAAILRCLNLAIRSIDQTAQGPPAAQLASLVAEWVGDEPLRVVAVLETRRTVRNLTGAGGEALAEVADDLVTGRLLGPGNDLGEPVNWREIEVELVFGGPEILAAARDRLTAAGARPSRFPSKLVRLLGTRAASSAPGAGGGQQLRRSS